MLRAPKKANLQGMATESEGVCSTVLQLSRKCVIEPLDANIFYCSGLRKSASQCCLLVNIQPKKTGIPSFFLDYKRLQNIGP